MSACREPLDSQPNELGWPVLQVGIQGKYLVCGWVCSLAVWKVRRPIGMVKSRIEETEEEFDARMAAISSEAKNAEKLQAKPI